MGWIVQLVLGIVKWLFGGRQSAEGEALGKAEVQRDTAQAEVKQAEKANEIDTQVSSDSDSTLDAELRAVQPKGTAASGE